MLVFDGKTYTYQEEKIDEYNGKIYTDLVVRDEDGNRVEIKHWDEVSLDDVQVGDWVVVVRSGRTIPVSHTLRKVERVTRTQLTVKGTRFMKSTGNMVGQSNYYNSRKTSVQAYNPEDEICNWAYFFTRREAQRKRNEWIKAKAQVKARFLELLNEAETLEEVKEILK